MEKEVKCEECGSPYFMQITKDGITMEIVKHYSDCPIIKGILNGENMIDEVFKAFRPLFSDKDEYDRI